MKSGVPYDVAFALTPVDTTGHSLDEEALALSVCFGEMEGGTFDWQAMTWIERNG